MDDLVGRWMGGLVGGRISGLGMVWLVDGWDFSCVEF